MRYADTYTLFLRFGWYIPTKKYRAVDGPARSCADRISLQNCTRGRMDVALSISGRHIFEIDQENATPEALRRLNGARVEGAPTRYRVAWLYCGSP